MPDSIPCPDAAEAACAAAETLFRARRIAEAAAAYERAVALGMDAHATAEPRWMCAMLLGAFEQAWRISDEVLRQRAGTSCAHLPHHLRRVWDGAPLAGRSVLVRCYHGLGDTLQFIRYVPLLGRMARRVTVEAQPALLPLLASVPGIDALVPLDAPLPPGIEAEIESMELPHALRTTVAAIPAAVPYLAVPEGPVSLARALVAQCEGRLKVGLAWAAGDWDQRRSLPVELLAALDAFPHLALFNLQRGPALGQLVPGRGPAFVHRRGESTDVLETAALMTHLDLIVTVDTMVAHLAGALGRPVWTLLHFAADWRWLLDRADSPWYPTMRLFRQPSPGAWEPVVARVAAELAGMRPPRIDAAGSAFSPA
jgi:hypothetical protein